MGSGGSRSRIEETQGPHPLPSVPSVIIHEKKQSFLSQNKIPLEAVSASLQDFNQQSSILSIELKPNNMNIIKTSSTENIHAQYRENNNIKSSLDQHTRLSTIPSHTNIPLIVVSTNNYQENTHNMNNHPLFQRRDVSSGVDANKGLPLIQEAAAPKPSRRSSWSMAQESSEERAARRLSWDGAANQSPVNVTSVNPSPIIHQATTRNRLFDRKDELTLDSFMSHLPSSLPQPIVSQSYPKDTSSSTTKHQNNMLIPHLRQDSEEDISFYKSSLYNNSAFIAQKKTIDAHNAQLEEEVEALQRQLIILDRHEKEREREKKKREMNGLKPAYTIHDIKDSKREHFILPSIRLDDVIDENMKQGGSLCDEKAGSTEPSPDKAGIVSKVKRRAVRSPIRVEDEISNQSMKEQTKDDTSLDSKFTFNAANATSSRRKATSTEMSEQKMEDRPDKLALSPRAMQPKSPREPRANKSTNMHNIKRKMNLKSRSEVMSEVVAAAVEEVQRVVDVGKAGIVMRKMNAKKNSGSNQSLWTPALAQSWTEVEFLLRRPINSDDDLVYAKASSEAGLLFIDQLTALAESLGILRGTISRWILPYDNNTSLQGGQCSTPISVSNNMPSELRGRITDRQIHYLVNGANNVRQLVRVKIADDNDLLQARTAVHTSLKFFKQLDMVSKAASISSFELLTIGRAATVSSL